MQKRGILAVFSIIFLLVLMPDGFSIYEEIVYSGTVEDKDIINISNHLFEFRIDSISSKVYVEIDISGIIIASGECKIKDSFDICIKNVSFSYRNYTEYLDVYKAAVDVYQIKSKVDITNAIEKNNILIGEEITAALTIENTADVVAEDVTATIKIPSSVLITDTDGCKKIFDSIIFNADVHPRQIKTCTYKIKGLAPGDFELTSNVSYFDGIKKISTASNTLSGKVYNYSLKVSSKLNKSEFNILENLNLTVDIENINDQYDLTITTLSLKLPEKLLLIKKPKDTISANRIISWSGTLEPKEKKSFVVQLQSRITGNYSILTEASYKINKFSRSAKSVSNIEVYCNCPYIYHDFSQQIAVPDQRIGLKANIINPSPINDFKNVKIGYVTNIPNIQDFSTAYANIKPLETINIFDSSITTPNLNEIYNFNITAIYESSANQVFIVRDNIIIKIPSVEEEPEEEKQEVEQEEIEEQEVEEVTLDTKKTEETIWESEKGIEEEIPVTTLEEEKKPVKALAIIAYIAAIIFILIVLIVFKRKKGEDIEKYKEAKEEEKSSIKEFLSILFRKKEGAERKTEYPGGEREYRDLERQIRQLGIASEREKQKKK